MVVAMAVRINTHWWPVINTDRSAVVIFTEVVTPMIVTTVRTVMELMPMGVDRDSNSVSVVVAIPKSDSTAGKQH